MGCWGCVGFEVMECFFSCFSVCNGYPTSMVITTDRRICRNDGKAWKSIYVEGRERLSSHEGNGGPCGCTGCD